MIGRDKLIQALWSIVSQAESEATAVLTAANSGLTRYANNYIHQNMYTETVQVSLRAKVGKKVGSAIATGLDPDKLLEALRKAEAIAKASPEIPYLAPLQGMRAYRQVETFDPHTAFFSAEDRAKAVKIICDKAKAHGAIASGLFSTGYSEMVVVNSSGINGYAPLSTAEIMIIIGDGPSSGYSGRISRTIRDIDVEMLSDTALDKCIAGKTRAEIEPGDYEVILEQTAVADALEWLTYIGLGSKSVEEGTSFLAGRKGKQLVGENITIYDDAYNSKALGVPFDFEGTPKQAVYFFNKGVAGSGVSDTTIAHKNKTYSTGHAVPAEESSAGALPMNVIMAPGDATLPEMISQVERGIYVTRFHYINGFIDTREAVLTGMTRDGTFLIENGEITSGLPNMRFMQSFLESFRKTVQISKDQVPSPSWWGDNGAYLTPAIRVKDFRFIGVQKES